MRLCCKRALEDEVTAEERRLVGLVGVLVAVAVWGVSGALVLLGELGLWCQDAGEGEQGRAGSDDGQAARLTQAQGERGHGQGQSLQLGELVCLKLLLLGGEKTKKTNKSDLWQGIMQDFV